MSYFSEQDLQRCCILSGDGIESFKEMHSLSLNVYQFSAFKKESNMLKKVVIPAEAGIQISLLVLDSRFHGNDRENGPVKNFVSKS